MITEIKRLLVGNPLETAAQQSQRLSKPVALREWHDFCRPGLYLYGQQYRFDYGLTCQSAHAIVLSGLHPKRFVPSMMRERQ
jgi:hypothetical protein